MIDLFSVSQKTKVVFLVDVDGEDNNVFAFFPEKDFNNCLKQCYEHGGQHSGCSVTYTKACKEAKREEYIHLKFELEKEGYELDILNVQ